MKTNDIREAYLSFFEEKKHTRVPSASLIPENDPTLLFTVAGMVQFKDYFMGIGKKPFSRATSSQKCFRTGDIENVGRTDRHQTFFEMLGNFSFGDYFKREAISYAWEFLTNVLKIDKDRLWLSVYKDDEEAFRLWKETTGVADIRIQRFGEHDNFWPANCPSQGPNGPCGPCSEIYFDPRPEETKRKLAAGEKVNYDWFIEIWNLVFMQFERQEGGLLQPLPNKNIDTGMGLERMAAMMQGKKSNYENDVFVPIINEASQILGINYVFDSEEGARLRRIADHARAVAFCISDDALPSNLGRGYVVRKILRHAVSDGKFLGMGEPFLYKLLPVITEVMTSYPALKENFDIIELYIKNEEKSFLKTLAQGMHILEKEIQEMKGKSQTVLDGPKAFKLYDTYGLPLEESTRLLEEQGLSVDKKGFEKEMENQRLLSQAGSNISSEVFEEGYLSHFKNQFPKTSFLGYGTTHLEKQTILSLVRGEEIHTELQEGDEGIVLFAKTPFYAESGGQVGDKGRVETATGTFEVQDTQNVEGYFLHQGKVLKGTLKIDQLAKINVDVELREATRKNHTATHLLHKYLKSIVGDHVSQKGSYVGPDRLRFDFTNPEGVSKEDLRKIESEVNRVIMERVPVETYQTSLKEAKSAGIIALFGEKYGETVRVVKVGEVSSELCGGTHVDNIVDIDLFKITSESAIAQGIRRIEAITGEAARRLMIEELSQQTEIAELFKQKGFDFSKLEISDPDQLKREDLFRLSVPASSLGTELSTVFNVPPAGILPAYVRLFDNFQPGHSLLEPGDLNTHEGIFKLTERFIEKKQAEQKELARIRKAGFATELEATMKNAPLKNGSRVITHHLEGADAQDLKNLSETLKKLQEPYAAMFVSKEGDKAHVVINIEDSLISKLKAGDLIKEIGAIVGGKGGGRPNQAQGGGTLPQNIPQAIAKWNELTEKLL